MLSRCLTSTFPSSSQGIWKPLIHLSVMAFAFDVIGRLTYGRPFGCLGWPLRSHRWLNMLYESETSIAVLFSITQYFPVAVSRSILTVVAHLLQAHDESSINTTKLLKQRELEPTEGPDLLKPLETYVPHTSLMMLSSNVLLKRERQ